MRSLSLRIKIKILKVIRKIYQSSFLILKKNKISNYQDLIDLVKNEFESFYFDIGPEHGVLEGLDYEGANTHCTQCLYTLTRLTNARNVLEIGSYHYKTSNQIAKAIDDNYGINSEGVVITFDIIKGGHNNDEQRAIIDNERVVPNFWYPYKTKDTEDIESSKFVYPNHQYENNEIVELNLDILSEVSIKNKIKYYDLIFIDGDHSYEGIKNDFKIISKYSNKDTLIVIDNIWDKRLLDVKKFFDEQKYKKWNFKEFNDKYYSKNKVQDTGILIIN